MDVYWAWEPPSKMLNQSSIMRFQHKFSFVHLVELKMENKLKYLGASNAVAEPAEPSEAFRWRDPELVAASNSSNWLGVLCVCVYVLRAFQSRSSCRWAHIPNWLDHGFGPCKMCVCANYITKSFIQMLFSESSMSDRRTQRQPRMGDRWEKLPFSSRKTN